MTNHFDPEMSMLADRHYFLYSGRKIVIRDAEGTILFGWVWPEEKYRMDGQSGFNCAIFRNESKRLSSELILECEEIAIEEWGPNRMFTYVDPRKLRTIKRRGREFCRWPPGRCFIEAGWKFAGISKKGKHLFVKEQPRLPQAVPHKQPTLAASSQELSS